MRPVAAENGVPKMNWKVIVAGILLLLIVIFAVQNYAIVEIKFLLWSFRASRAVILFLTLILGFALGWLVSLIPKGKE